MGERAEAGLSNSDTSLGRSGDESQLDMFRWIFRLVAIALVGKLVNRYLVKSQPRNAPSQD